MLMNVKLENLFVMITLCARTPGEATYVSVSVDMLGMEETAVSPLLCMKLAMHRKYVHMSLFARL